jgi:uncharacterized membrane protein YqjE
MATTPPGSTQDRSIADLTKELSTQTTQLIRQEMELARAELTQKGKTAGVGAGIFGAAGLIALFGVGALTACLILALDTAVDGWLAALIVGVAYLAVAGVAALIGRGKVQEASPPVPEQAIETTKEDVEWTKQRVQNARK